MKRKPTKLVQLLVIAALLIFILLFPQMTTTNYYISVAVQMFVFAAMATSWNILGGYAGQVSWCHASFLAIGAYSATLLYTQLGVTPWLGMFVGAALSIILAFVIGNAAFKLRGIFFSLLTISFVEIIRVLLLYWKDLTRGAEGVVITYREHSWLNLTFRTDSVFYYIMFVLLLLSIFISWRVERSKMGYYLKAIRADQDAAESLGIEAYQIKLKALLISAAMTSIIGSFYAFFLTYIDPNTVSALAISTKIGSIAIVGGVGTLFGPAIGAAVLIPLSEWANALLGQSGSGMLLYGLIMVIIVIFRPQGIISFFVKEDGQASVPFKLVEKVRGRFGRSPKS